MSKVFSTKRTLSADRMFLNVYLRFQDFIFSPKIGYIEEKMKKRPKKMPLSEWKVLLFASNCKFCIFPSSACSSTNNYATESTLGCLKSPLPKKFVQKQFSLVSNRFLGLRPKVATFFCQNITRMVSRPLPNIVCL